MIKIMAVISSILSSKDRKPLKQLKYFLLKKKNEWVAIQKIEYTQSVRNFCMYGYVV